MGSIAGAKVVFVAVGNSQHDLPRRPKPRRVERMASAFFAALNGF